MSAFWGYPGADWLCGLVVALASALCLLAARSFVRGYDNAPVRRPRAGPP